MRKYRTWRLRCDVGLNLDVLFVDRSVEQRGEPGESDAIANNPMKIEGLILVHIVDPRDIRRDANVRTDNNQMLILAHARGWRAEWTGHVEIQLLS